MQAATDLLNAHFPSVLHTSDSEAATGTYSDSAGAIYISRKPVTTTASPTGAVSYSTRLSSLGPRSGLMTAAIATKGPPKGSPHARLGYASTVSTKPMHVTLNLQVQAFIEAARTVPLPYPAHTHTSTAGAPGSRAGGTSSLNAAPGVGVGMGMSVNGSAAASSTSVASGSGAASTSASAAASSDAFSAHQTELLHRAQRLYAAVESLRDLRDRDVYREELKQVGGLLAYPAPERSPMARYMRQERREAVADQVNSAILCEWGFLVIC